MYKRCAILLQVLAVVRNRTILVRVLGPDTEPSLFMDLEDTISMIYDHPIVIVTDITILHHTIIRCILHILIKIMGLEYIIDIILVYFR